MKTKTLRERIKENQNNPIYGLQLWLYDVHLALHFAKPEEGGKEITLPFAEELLKYGLKIH